MREKDKMVKKTMKVKNGVGRPKKEVVRKIGDLTMKEITLIGYNVNIGIDDIVSVLQEASDILERK